MRRTVWFPAIVATALLAACAPSRDPSSELSMSMAKPTRTAGLPGVVMRLTKNDEADDPTSLVDLTPSKGDVVGFGGSLIGELAAGVPGGAVLGLSGQLAGGNGVGKAAGSTLGAILGSMLGPFGSMVGSLFGGYVGEQHDSRNSEMAAAGPGPAYIESLDFGPPREKAS